MKNSSRKCRRKGKKKWEEEDGGTLFIIHTSTDGRESWRESVRVPEVVKVVVDLKPITALHYLPFSSLVWLTPGGKGMVGGTWDEIKRRGLIKEI
jgi:hypothetical protein